MAKGAKGITNKAKERNLQKNKRHNVTKAKRDPTTRSNYHKCNDA